MPKALARIFTHHRDQITNLVQQLEQHGYAVEILHPEDAPVTPAALEIEWEVCDSSDVLRRAAELASNMQADIAVAIGALQIQSVSKLAQDEPAIPEEVGTHAATVPELGPTSAPIIAEPAGATEAAEEWIMQHEDNSGSGSLWARVVPAWAAALSDFRKSAGDLMVFLTSKISERMERIRIRTAESRALREHHLLQLTRRRIEAQQQLGEFADARRAAAAYLLQLERECSGVLSAAQRGLSGQEHEEDPSHLADLSKSSWRMKPWSQYLRSSEAVLAGVAIAVALFVARLAVTSFHSRPANPPGGVTVQAHDAAVPESQTKLTPPARPSPVVKTWQKRTATSARVHQPHAPRRQINNDDVVVQDVVVRHFATAKLHPNVQQAGVKHYSDLDD